LQIVLSDVASAKLVTPFSANTWAPHWTANGRNSGGPSAPVRPAVLSGRTGSNTQRAPESPGRVRKLVWDRDRLLAFPVSPSLRGPIRKSARYSNPPSDLYR